MNIVKRLKIIKEGVPYEFYKEIKLPSDEKEKSKLLGKLNNNVVLVKDDHIAKDCYQKGLLIYDKKDPEVYSIESLKNDEKVTHRFHVHDLLGIMVEEY